MENHRGKISNCLQLIESILSIADKHSRCADSIAQSAAVYYHFAFSNSILHLDGRMVFGDTTTLVRLVFVYFNHFSSRLFTFCTIWKCQKRECISIPLPVSLLICCNVARVPLTLNDFLWNVPLFTLILKLSHLKCIINIFVVLFSPNSKWKFTRIIDIFLWSLTK